MSNGNENDNDSESDNDNDSDNDNGQFSQVSQVEDVDSSYTVNYYAEMVGQLFYSLLYNINDKSTHKWSTDRKLRVNIVVDQANTHFAQLASLWKLTSQH